MQMSSDASTLNSLSPKKSSRTYSRLTWRSAEPARPNSATPYSRFRNLVCLFNFIGTQIRNHSRDKISFHCARSHDEAKLNAEKSFPPGVVRTRSSSFYRGAYAFARASSPHPSPHLPLASSRLALGVSQGGRAGDSFGGGESGRAVKSGASASPGVIAMLQVRVIVCTPACSLLIDSLSERESAREREGEEAREKSLFGTKLQGEGSSCCFYLIVHASSALLRPLL